MKYRKKPVVIEALQFDGNFNEIELFVGGDAEFRGKELVILVKQGGLNLKKLIDGGAEQVDIDAIFEGSDDV